jgi:cytoskeletal protein CcmA (bactofilin family)
VSMWSKREEPPAPRPASAPPPPAPAPAPVPELRKEPTPVSTNFTAPPQSAATIGKSVKVVGKIFAKEDLYVDGDVEGTIESADNKVTVGPNGRVQANIVAREVIIIGQVQGNVETSDKVDLRKDAKLVGDITTARISIEDGAVFKGSIDIRKPEVKTAVPVAAPATVSHPPEHVAAATPAAASSGSGPVRR